MHGSSVLDFMTYSFSGVKVRDAAACATNLRIILEEIMMYMNNRAITTNVFKKCIRDQIYFSNAFACKHRLNLY